MSTMDSVSAPSNLRPVLCNACGISGLSPDGQNCGNCFAPLVAKEESKAPRRRRWPTFLGGLVVGLLTWPALGMLLGPSEAASPALDRASLNTAFMTMMSQEVAVKNARMFLANWEYDSDSTLYFEMTPPSAAMPVVAWETLTKEDQSGVMGFFAVAYDRFLLENNESPISEDGRFVSLGLKYLGIASPLAIRRATGDVETFRSPYVRP